jgi:hypothetical protein
VILLPALLGVESSLEFGIEVGDGQIRGKHESPWRGSWKAIVAVSGSRLAVGTRMASRGSSSANRRR